MVQKKSFYSIITILSLACLFGCVTWSSGNPGVSKLTHPAPDKAYEKLNYSYSSNSPYPEVVKNARNRIEEKMKSSGIFQTVENRPLLSNTEKATYFLEIQNSTIDNHWAYNGILYVNAFASGFTLTVWPFYFPVTEKFEFTMYKYDTKKSNFVKIYSKEYTPTVHSLAGVSTIPILWLNFFTNGSYQLLDELVEDFFHAEEWKK